MFPIEIVERILYYCDGITLHRATQVNKEWKTIVEYLSRETDVWMRCCYNDIPKNELLQYKTKWIRKQDENTRFYWKHIYTNWMNWHNIEENIDIDVVLKGSIQRITCIAAAGKYLAVGLENGLVKIFNWDFDCLKTLRQVSVAIDNIFMICDNDSQTSHLEEILVHCCDRIYINDFNTCDILQPVIFPNCFKFSHFKKYICGVTQEGKITIAKITKEEDGRTNYKILTYFRIFSPDIVTAVRLWEHQCIILIKNKVKILNIDNGNLQRLVTPEEKVRLKFVINNGTNAQNTRIFNDKLIISLSKSAASSYQQIFELFILGDNNTYSKKQFLPWVILRAHITAMLLYGNTFLVGMSNGTIYFYQINDWKYFDLNNYIFVSIGTKACPIISIDVVELYGRRIFFVTSALMIYQITGYSIDSLDDLGL